MHESLVKASEAINTSEHCDQEVRNVRRQSKHHVSFSMLVSKCLKLLRKAKEKNTNMRRTWNRSVRSSR